MATAVVCTATGALLVIAMLADPHLRWWVVGVLWYPGAGAFLIYQLIPKHVSPAPFVEPGDRAMMELSQWVHDRCGWRPRVRLTPRLELWAKGDVLWVGLPAAAGLDEDELAAWVHEALAHQRVTESGTIGFACFLAEGSLGRGLWGRTDARLGRWLLGGVHRRVQRFESQLAAHAAARRAMDFHWPGVEGRLAIVADAWDHVVEQWLEPALAHRSWHADPFSGLALFLGACELAGFVEPSGRAAGALPALASLETLATAESAVAQLLVAGALHDEEPITWEQHPIEVTVATWRTQLSEGLHAAARVTGSPLRASFDAVDEVFGDEGASLAWVLPHGPGSDPEAPARTRAGGLLRTTASLALIEAGQAFASWEWPWGTVLRDGRGELVPLVGDPEEPDVYRRWLTAYDVDTAAPLWLSGGREPEDERPLYVVGVLIGWRRREAVITDQGIRVLPGRARLAQTLHRYVDGPVAGPDPAGGVGDYAGLEGLRWNDVVGAVLRPRMGGTGWRLVLRSPTSRLKLCGLGGAKQEERVLHDFLGERLHVRWSHVRPRLRRARNWLGYACLGLGGLAVSVAAVAIVRPPDDVTTRLDWIEFGLAGIGVLLVGLIPDLLASLRERRSFAGRRHRPEPAR